MPRACLGGVPGYLQMRLVWSGDCCLADNSINTLRLLRATYRVDAMLEVFGLYLPNDVRPNLKSIANQ
jgi:hypothetical protein